jgi:hypothetical protein
MESDPDSKRQSPDSDPNPGFFKRCRFGSTNLIGTLFGSFKVNTIGEPSTFLLFGGNRAVTGVFLPSFKPFLTLGSGVRRYSSNSRVGEWGENCLL